MANVWLSLFFFFLEREREIFMWLTQQRVHRFPSVSLSIRKKEYQQLSDGLPWNLLPTFMVPIGWNLKTLVLLLDHEQVRLFTQLEKYVNNVWWWIALNLGADIYCFSDKSSKLNWPKKKNTFLMRPPFQRDNIVCPWCKKQVGAGAPSTWNIKRKKNTHTIKQMK